MYSNDLICEILKYIDIHLLEKISVNDLCKEFHYNRYYIMKLFKKEMGYSIINYINALRIYKSAMAIINNPKQQFLNIALNNGFTSLEYFSETFKNIMTINPLVFKNSIIKKNKTTINTMLIIQDRLSFLKSIFNLKKDYISRQKPSIYPVKKLSIFK